MPEEITGRMGIRKDPELYDRIINAFEISRDEHAEVFALAEINQRVHDNEPWGALPKMERPEHLTKMKVPLADDVIETGLSVSTARTPMPTVEPEIEQRRIEEVLRALKINQDEVEGLDEQGAVEEYQKAATLFADGLTKHMVKHWRANDIQQRLRTVVRGKGVKGTATMKVWKEGNDIKEEVCQFDAIFPAPGVHTIKALTQ